VALVTGAGRGIGRTIALALAEAGVAVVALARSAHEVTETTALIDGIGGRAIGVIADVTDRSDVERAVQEALAILGPIDLLVNNAGVVGPSTPLWETDPDEWWRALEINLRGPLLCARAVLPAMIQIAEQKENREPWQRACHWGGQA
jgi:NAD(P)-dependent dehydrogenase (short-subunit alcohol dehydrogenase family)